MISPPPDNVKHRTLRAAIHTQYSVTGLRSVFRRDETDTSHRTKKVFFVLLLLAILGTFPVFDKAIRVRLADEHRELVDHHLERLANATLSQISEFSPECRIRNQGTAFLDDARQQIASQAFLAKG